jgi:hypothetical protein
LNVATQSQHLALAQPLSPQFLTGDAPVVSVEELFKGMRDRAEVSLYKPIISNVPSVGGNLSELLANSRASFKVLVSQVSMHLGLDWLRKLFNQIDSLLDVEEWDPRDPPPSIATARTFIRMLLVLKVSRRPGIGVDNNGNLIAAWTVGSSRLTVECLADDKLRWVLAREMDGEIVRAAADGKIDQLKSFLAPYYPSVWFEYGE